MSLRKPLVIKSAGGFEELPANDSVDDFLAPLASAEISVTNTVTATIGRMHVCSGTTANYTVTLPSVTGNAGKFIAFRMSGALTVFVTISGAATGQNIDGILTRVMHNNESCTLLCDGVTWTKIAGKTIPFFVEVDASDQTLASNAFTKLTMGTIVTDDNGLWNTSTSVFTVPRLSLFVFEGQYRLPDNATVTSYGLGVNTSLVDANFFSWYVSVSASIGYRRNGAFYSRTVKAALSAQYFFYYYIEASGLALAGAKLTIKEIPTW